MPRQLKYLSPSGISLYRQDLEAFYLRYLAGDKRGPDDPQSQAMAAGSAFDAYAKSYIYEALFGKGHDPRYQFENIFDAQVEQQWRDWGKLHGMYIFETYRKSGALADLMLDLQQAVAEPKFEIEIMGVINSRRQPKMSVVDNPEDTNRNVVLLGRPDVFYINKFGSHVIVDWKVNGYVSKYNISPVPGYIKVREPHKNKSGEYQIGKPHPDCQLINHNGTMINGKAFLEERDVSWATQLSIYAWLSGVEVGDDFIAGIDQICCQRNGTEFPNIRVAEHRMRVKSGFQYEVFELAEKIWRDSYSGHFFSEYSLEDSKERCRLLDEQGAAALESNLSTDALFNEMTAPPKRYR